MAALGGADAMPLSSVARFVPSSQDDLAPSGGKARYAANVAAIRLTRTLAVEGRAATTDEQAVLARWSSWGAIPEVFDEAKPAWAAERAELRGLLSEAEWNAAARTTINAHYTDPLIVRHIWRTLTGLGFTEGAVLEPGSGAGTFLGLAPEGAAMTGVELDPITAAISQALYPQASVRSESFADTRLPEGFFDAGVGNVPFSEVVLHDAVHNPNRHSMHNHFIVKTLRLTRPGGLVAVLTSSFTMDARNPAARREMADLADLVGAIRLPNGAHRRAAGTEALSDLLVFRRREDDQAPAVTEGEWELTVPVTVPGDGGQLREVRINAWFDAHPEMVLGDLRVGTGQYNADTLRVDGNLDRLDDDLTAAVDGLVFTGRRMGLTMSPRDPGQPAPRPVARAGSGPELWDGSILAGTDGGFATVTGGGTTTSPLAVPKTHARELRALLALRDQATGLLALEAASVDDTEEITAARAGLAREYRKYVGVWGPINRFTRRPTGRTDEHGEATFARVVPPAVRVLRGDPFGALVLALESFDEAEQTATPAALLSHRVVAPRPDVQGVDTPAEAIAVSLDRTGGLDLVLIADLLGITEAEAQTALTTPMPARDGAEALPLAFVDPGPGPAAGEVIHAPEYLSGDVRVKLEAARAAAATDAAFAINVAALESVLPADLGVEDIAAKLGAVWISPEVHARFLNELLGSRDGVRVENPMPGMWEVRADTATRRSLAAVSEWGTARRNAVDLAQAVMEQRTITVNDEIEDVEGRKRQVPNPVETTAAQEKADALSERFAEWVWEDPERAATLAAEYNRRFNSIVLRDYTAAGEYLSLPGMAASFTPRAHQRAAVARMIAEPAALLAHEVGAGKTAEMVMGAMEMRRMGLIRKPVVVVPNHMLEQFGREWLQIYPQARILTASSTDLTADKRRLFVARAAANEWDAVVMTQGALARIPLRPQTQQAYITAEVERVRAVLHQATGEDRMSVKRIQKRLLVLEERAKKLTDLTRDAGVCFEDTGIDYVIVDEMHLYKNLATDSNIAGAAISGSDRASDLHMKLNHLRATGRERVVTGATATPISNSVTEAYVMQRYLRPDLLEAAGIGAFDAWAATFGQTVTQMEMSPTGNNAFRVATRFAKFQNVPEMLRLWSVFADVKTGEDLQLPVPLLAERADGQRLPVTTVVQPTVELEEYVDRLGERAGLVAARMVLPSEDNMLLITTDGRKAALDMRMVRADMAPSGVTKVDAAADAIHATWMRTRDNTYLDPATGEPSPVPGGLQLVFSDIGTPTTDQARWSAYQELKSLLVARGMPEGAVRFMHAAKTDADKARLFAAARAGHVAVLIGSTEKMGVGTNVQARAVALWHLDCPWRPSDIAQREGRILRQGNQNREVTITRFVTERSFDAYMWQGVERKATFIGQIMRGSLDVREIEEIDTAALSAAEAKAISSGNPLLLEHSTAQNETTRLRRLERAWQQGEAMLTHTKRNAEQSAEHAAAAVTGLEAAVPKIVDTSGDKFRITLDGRFLTSRTDAAATLASWAARTDIRYARPYASREYGVIGQIAGFDLTLAVTPGLDQPQVRLALATVTDHNLRGEATEVPRTGFTVPRDTLLHGDLGLITRIENRVSGIPHLLNTARDDHQRAQTAAADAQARMGQPFKHAAALAAAEADLARLDALLADMQEEQHSAAASTSEPAPPPVHEPAPGEATVQAGATGEITVEEITVEMVRNYPGALGVRADPSRNPPPAYTSGHRPGPRREPPAPRL